MPNLPRAGGGPAIVAGPPPRGPGPCRRRNAAVPPDRARARAGRDACRTGYSPAQRLAVGQIARRSSSSRTIAPPFFSKSATPTALIYAPGVAEPIWVKLNELEPAYTGRAVVVETDPTREREGRAAVGQGQAYALVLVRSVEGPPGILAGPAGSADRQPARVRDAAVHDERLRPGHPQQGGIDLVGARRRRDARAWRSTSCCASPGRG